MPRKGRKKSRGGKATGKNRAKQAADAVTAHASSSFDNANDQVAAGDTVTMGDTIPSAISATQENATDLPGNIDDVDDATVRKLFNPMDRDDTLTHLFSCLIQVDATSQPHTAPLLTTISVVQRLTICSARSRITSSRGATTELKRSFARRI